MSCSAGLCIMGLVLRVWSPYVSTSKHIQFLVHTVIWTVLPALPAAEGLAACEHCLGVQDSREPVSILEGAFSHCSLCACACVCLGHRASGGWSRLRVSCIAPQLSALRQLLPWVPAPACLLSVCLSFLSPGLLPEDLYWWARVAGCVQFLVLGVPDAEEVVWQEGCWARIAKLLGKGDFREPGHRGLGRQM